MQRVLITGSQGYIGSVLTSFLEEHGHQCIGYDTGFFRDSLLYAPSQSDSNTVFRDARDITSDDLDGIDALVHLAGISNDPLGKLNASQVYDPTRAYSRAIATKCKQRGVRFIFASSCSVYGVGGEDLLTESSNVSPQTGYSLNKLQIEQDLQDISDKTFSPIALRFATVFGSSPRIRFDVVVNMLTGMAVSSNTVVMNSDGTPWRPNLHILDACEAVRRAVECDYRGGELLVLNVGDEANNLQVIQIARTIAGTIPGSGIRFLTDSPDLDKEGLIRDRKVKQGVDTRTYRVSFERVRKVFQGFRCGWSVERGVSEMVARFRQLGFDDDVFKRRGFYRLQQLEHLHDNGFLSDDLHWQTGVTI